MNWKRVAWARFWAQCSLVVGGVALFLGVMGLMAGPQYMDPDREFDVAGVPIDVLAVAGILFGLAWMWRLYRAPTRYDRAVWRYRGH